jgi:hypothetical protein
MSVRNVVDIRGILDSHVEISDSPFLHFCRPLRHSTTLLIPLCCHQLDSDSLWYAFTQVSLAGAALWAYIYVL